MSTATAYVVLATQLHQLVGDKGDVKRHSRGDVVTDLTDDDVERHLRAQNIAAKGSAEEEAAFAPPPEPEPPEFVTVTDEAVPPDADAPAPAPAEPVKRPPRAASKERWIAYHVARGMTKAAAGAMSLADLKAKK